jgi:GxxExxY protein
VDFETSREIIGCAMRVHTTLGCGFLESVYERALAIELQKHGIAFQRQVPYKIYYHDVQIGTYTADLVARDRLLLELKATSTLIKAHETQLLNYLNASNIQVGLLINFGTTSLQFKRMTIAPYQKTAQSNP